jgi:hypothetical protein
MREISVPIPFTENDEVAEVEVKFSNKKISIQYRLESFPWDISDDIDLKPEDEITEKLMKIYRLKKTIAEYDPAWELIQIFTPSANSKFIQILFRKK